eukprot:350255-Chlamydomonas_euryale.AAC.6
MLCLHSSCRPQRRASCTRWHPPCALQLHGCTCIAGPGRAPSPGAPSRLSLRIRGGVLSQPHANPQAAGKVQEAAGGGRAAAHWLSREALPYWQQMRCPRGCSRKGRPFQV